LVIVKNEKDKLIVELGQNIKKIRLSKNLTQLELSIDSGVPLSQIGAIESGKINTTVKTLIKISESLDLNVKDLFTF
jgi:transcriptional regulator with XRE-family HTH domain